MALSSSHRAFIDDAQFCHVRYEYEYEWSYSGTSAQTIVLVRVGCRRLRRFVVRSPSHSLKEGTECW
eukprot:scaffold397416_cov19-Prasinocladus_malaysianus.AAC.1